jgi:DNA-binding transcriptional ArsR family regulator
MARTSTLVRDGTETDDLFENVRREPYAKIPGYVFTCGLNPAAIVLYGWLSARYGGFKAGTFPAVATLTAELGISRRTVQRALADLTAAGWLTVKERPGTTNLYRLVKSPREAVSLRARREAASSRKRRAACSQVKGGCVTDGAPGASLMAHETARRKQLEIRQLQPSLRKLIPDDGRSGRRPGVSFQGEERSRVQGLIAPRSGGSQKPPRLARADWALSLVPLGTIGVSPEEVTADE